MIVKNRLSWVRMLLTIRGSSLAKTYRRITVITLFATVVTVLEEEYGIEMYSLTLAPFTLIGVALGIFLGFFNNAAYDRYWEGRKLWGALVNTSRSFARQTTNLITLNGPTHEQAALHHELVQKMIGYVHALRHHLRNTFPNDDVNSHLTDDELVELKNQRNVPIYIIRRMGERIQWAWKQGWVDTYHVSILENSLTSLTDIQGGCERIKNTPIPFAYTLLTHRIVAFYCFALPFGLVGTVGVLTPVVVLLISHAFLGLDDIGNEIEDPFGTEPQHLPLTSLCRTIEINLLQHMDETDIPEMLEPVDDILP